MKVFTVHRPPQRVDDPADLAEGIAFVKDGFCWPALFIAFIWLVWHRMWLVLLGWLAIGLAIGLVGEFLPAAEPYVVPASLAYAVLFALEANALRRWTLARNGWRFIAVASGRNREEAEQGFFTRWVDEAGRGAPVVRRPTRSAPARRVEDEPVIGLFPEPN